MKVWIVRMMVLAGVALALAGCDAHLALFGFPPPKVAVAGRCRSSSPTAKPRAAS